MEMICAVPETFATQLRAKNAPSVLGEECSSRVIVRPDDLMRHYEGYL
jgi:hypothetical protein